MFLYSGGWWRFVFLYDSELNSQQPSVLKVNLQTVTTQTDVSVSARLQVSSSVQDCSSQVCLPLSYCKM